MEMLDDATLNARFTDFCCAGTLLSATVKVSGAEFTAVVGVPAITPLAGVSDKPAGNEPALIDQVSGGVPPVAANVAVYALPTCATGSDVVVTASAAFTVTGNVTVCVSTGTEESCNATGAEESCTSKVTGAADGAVGVPEIEPLPLSESPAVNAPVLIDH